MTAGTHGDVLHVIPAGRGRATQHRVRMLVARASHLQLSSKAVLTHGHDQEYLNAEHAGREESYF